MTDKVENYTKEATADLVERYVGAEGDEGRKAVLVAVATELGKSVASVRAKTVREGVYVKAERATKRVARKAEMVTALAGSLGLDEIVLDSLEKATANALLAVIGAVGRIKREAEVEVE
jgi:hypothetical protein